MRDPSKPFVHPRWDISLKMPISLLINVQQFDHGLSVREDDGASVLWPDSEREFPSALASAFAISPNSKIVGSLKTSISTDRLSEYLAICKGDPGISEQHSTSMISLGLGQKTVSGTRVIPLNYDTGSLSGPSTGPQLAICSKTEWTCPIDTITSQISRCEERDISPQFTAQKPAKRIQEIVAESQTCVHDDATSSMKVARRKHAKRNFEEYSIGLQSIQTQRVHSDSTEGCHQKRQRLSTA